MMHDDDTKDSIAMLALGNLDEAEARTLSAHVATCAECSAEYRALRESADLVGFAGEDTQYAPTELQSARMRSRLMASIRSERPYSPTAPALVLPNGYAGGGSAPKRAPAWPAYLAAAAAIVLAIGTSLGYAQIRNEYRSFQQQVAGLQQHATQGDRQLATTQAQLADVIASDSRRYAFAGGEVVERGSHLYIALNALRPLPTGKVYQAWTFAPGSKVPVPSVTFGAQNGTPTIVQIPSDGHVGIVAVTVEPAGGSKAPTSKPIVVRALS